MKTLEVITSFMADCRARGLTDKTCTTYDSLAKELPILSRDYPPKAEIIQQALAVVKGGQYNRDARYRVWNAVGNYGKRRYGYSNFMENVARPKIRREIMPTISGYDLESLAIFLHDAPLRDKALLVLFIDTAIRAGEAANLRRKDVLAYDDRIIVKGKTGPRVAPISEITRELLLSIPSHPDGYVFHGTNRGKNSPRLKAHGMYDVVRKYIQGKTCYSGDKQFGPQLLRRSFGRFHLLDGGDISSLSRILGHRQISTTDNYYAPLLQQDVIEIHHKHTPARVFEEVAE